MQLKIAENEYWYGGATSCGIDFPLHQNSTYTVDLRINFTGNQASPLLLSNQGRLLWCEDGFLLECKDGILTITPKMGEVVYGEGYHTLRGAFLEASKRFFPPNGAIPPEEFFCKPQYNTWIEMMYHQTEKGVLQYAEGILKNGLTSGLLMIDCGWADYYGKFEFNTERFPNPAALSQKLHEMGFHVMLWICPFITADTQEFRLLRNRGLLVKNPNGTVRIVEWWDGYSAVLDLSNPEAVAWLKEQCDYLVNTYHIDGFKLDAGDAYFYRDDDVTYRKITPNEHSRLWVEFGLQYPFNEYRACYRSAGLPAVQRLSDKSHSWGNYGIGALLPNTLAQGILGYAFSCPDMIGGGLYTDFLPNAPTFEPELLVRYCAASAFMPMMQFSVAPWRVLDENLLQICRQFSELHISFAEKILELAHYAARTGEPIVRYLEYGFPHQGYAAVTDQFMLGDTILVAPVLEKEATQRSLFLPDGIWKDSDGQKYQGNQKITIPVTISDLPYFEKVG